MEESDSDLTGSQAPELKVAQFFEESIVYKDDSSSSSSSSIETKDLDDKFKAFKNVQEVAKVKDIEAV